MSFIKYWVRICWTENMVYGNKLTLRIRKGTPVSFIENKMVYLLMKIDGQVQYSIPDEAYSILYLIKQDNRQK